ncbi:MAG: glycosyltransferase, partial [Bacteroidaceae bacterium]
MTISSGTQVILLFVLIGFIACCSIYLIIFYLKIYYKVISKTKRCNNEVEANSNEIQDGTGISVIITANDQEYELRRNLEKILNQKYSKFEVIVVLDTEADDASEDLLAAYSEKYPNLYQTFIPKESKYLNRHKLMLSIGIKASHY